ncbi:non-ribosomal peptide synthetase [Nesterenkonia halotolerans]|uniref:Amino acid adenylation domain-containing protein n=1 Tax=Nesterenkonia halotolerans TaxID=225325 RepID=A0ABR9J6U9_9MICC|nr:non-ribosomal peptide synthetase [Nesterenkonia halotolerans]MBE1514729.1 amino acid adenylation domain-containing protein [Nesterenkonia halotolerans]
MAELAPPTSGSTLDSRLELTSAQRGIWYAQQLDPENATYQIGQYLELDGPVDTNILSLAWTKTLRDIDSLSMRFHEDAKGPFATLVKPDPAAALLSVVDLSKFAGLDTARAEARRRIDADMEKARVLDATDLCAAVLFKLPDGENWLFQRVHHIMLDGYSAVIALHYLAGVYSALAARVPHSLARGPVRKVLGKIAAKRESPFPSHQELLKDLHRYTASEQHAEDEAFWRDQVQSEASVEGLEGTPTGPARQVVRVALPLDPDESKLLRELGRDAPKTLVGIIAVYLARITGQDHVSVGLPVTARRGKVAKSTPSMLSNILPLHVSITPDASITDIVGSAGDTVRAAVRHQRFRVETLPGATGMAGPSVNLLPVVADLKFGSTTGKVHILSTGPVHDLSFVISGIDSQAATPTLQLEGDAALHSDQTLREHGERLRALITAALTAEPGTSVGQLPLTTAPETAALLDHGQGPDLSITAETALQAFTAATAAHPEARAVVAEDGVLSFQQLEADSTRLAHHLRRRGVGPGALVAVRIERSVNLPLLVLAVLKSGGAYVPLDPEYPIDRVQGMIEDSAPALLLTSRAQADSDRAAGADWKLPTMAVDADTEQAWRRATDDPSTLPLVSPNDLAYVVFTSGSTGRPKGVGVERLALRNLFQEHRDELFDPTQKRLGRRARVAHTAGLSFDAAWDPLLWLFGGHELHMISDEDRRDPQRLAQLLSEREIDFIETTPSFAEALLSTGLFEASATIPERHHPSVIAVGGEEVGPDLWNRLAALEDVHAVNLYGPTETTVDSLVAPITADTKPHIGGSVRNSRHYILDSALQPVPHRAVGELYLAGANVARGYVGQPGMSSARFVADPFAADGSRMYRTGDVVRRRSDGSLRFLGRMDDQVKIRGYRVELSEIEAALRSQPGVDQAAALVHGEGPTARLTGYVAGVANPGGASPVDGHAMRDQLRAELPDYMVPSVIMVLDGFPLTPNGKLDRKALPSPQATAAASSQRPRTAMQRRVAEAFAEVLQLDVDGIGVDEDFFAAGGHSLLATQLASLLSSPAESHVSVRDVFERPTVAGLAERLQQGEAADGPAPLHRMPHPETLPVSLTQRRLWFLNRLEPESAAYNIPVVLKLKGLIDTAALHEAFADVAARHEPLRTVFPLQEGEPIQKVLGGEAARPSFLAVSVPAERVDHVVTEEALRPFDITVETPLRGLLLSSSAIDHTLVAVMHHIASDGWSLRPFATDLSRAYAARAAGQEPELGELALEYSDFSLWQREHLGDPTDAGSEAHTQAEFWRRELDGAPAEIALPRDRARGVAPHGARTSAPHDAMENTTDSAADRILPQDPEVGVGQLDAEISPALHAQLRSLAASHSASLFMVLQSALAVTLKQHGAGEDIVVGTPVAGRSDPQLDELVGFFVNTLVLRTRLHQDPELAEVLERVREANTRAYAHQELPFDAVVDAVNPPRTAQMHPIFQVMLTLQNTEPARVELDGVEITVPAQMTSAGVKTDLMVDVSAPAGDDGGLHLALTYDAALFSPASAQRVLDTLLRGLHTLAEAPETRLSGLSAVDQETRSWLEEHSTAPALATSGTILDALEQTAARRPESPALQDVDHQLCFAELMHQVETIAANLHQAGVRSGAPVLLALPRSVDALSALLGILRAGAIAVPVDVSYPVGRISQIAASASPRAAILPEATDFRELELEQELLRQRPELLRLHTEDLKRPTGAAVPPAPQPADAAYLVHTSGTTGTPKGVQVPHSALRNVLDHHQHRLISPAQERCAPALPRMLHLSGLGFDAAWDPILWLVSGTTVVIPKEAQRVDAEAVVGLLTGTSDPTPDARGAHRTPGAGIDVVETTPSYAQQLLSLGLPEALERQDRHLTLALGGEAISGALWRTVADSPRLQGWNLYGPSEFTVDSVLTPITGDEPHIGRPINNLTARVLDSSLALVPPGVEGDLYLAGISEAHGYRGRPAETASAFVADPWSTGGRMYRTGDVVRRRQDGTLEFLRRDDDQVKIRGHRIEVAEVESVLGAVEGVESAVVRVVTPGGADTAQLAAWVVSSRSPEDLKSAASGLLPEYMLPTRILGVEEIPLTSHGKVDVAALPEPQVTAGARQPETEREQAVCDVMSEVLGVPSVGLDDDFFALGGHSLLAVTLVGRLEQQLGLSIPLRAVFEAGTPAQLLRIGARPAAADAGSGGENTSSRSAEPTVGSLQTWVQEHPRLDGAELPLTAGQTRLWFLNQLDPSSAEYNVVLHVELRGALDTAAMSGAIDDLVARHEVLRTTFPAQGTRSPSASGAPDESDAPAAAEARPVQLVHEPRSGVLGDEPLSISVGFDLSKEKPLRAALVALEGETDAGEEAEEAEQTWRLELVLHHIATDGASLAPLVRDLAASYTARACGGTALRRPLSVQFGDVARREAHLQELIQARGEEDPALLRWVDRLDAVPTELALPTDGQRVQTASQPAGQLRFTIPAELAGKVTAAATAQSASRFHGWLAGLAGYLRRIGAGEDVVIGSPSAGRTDPDVEELIGFFVNTLPLRLDLSEESLSFADAVSLARQQTLAALEDEHVPFEQIVERVRPERQLGRHPLFQTMLSVEQPTDVSLDLPNVTATPLDPGTTGSAKVDLSFTLRPGAGKDADVDGVLEFNAALFSERAAQALIHGWTRFLDDVGQAPDRPMLDAELAGTASDLTPWPAASQPEGRPAAVLESFATSVRRGPDATALVAAGSSLSFGELEARTRAIAAGLAAHGVQPGDVVALCLPRSVDTVAALLGSWWAGAVAMPIDTTLPESRVAAMLAAAAPRMVLHGDETVAPGPLRSSAELARDAAERAALNGAELLGMDSLLNPDAPVGDPLSGQDPRPETARSQDAAYLIFTSGTTGTPKGVQVPHGALEHLLASHRATLMPAAQEQPKRLAHTTGVGFDAAMDPILWLAAGHQVHLIEDTTRRDPQALVGYFREHRITAWETTPSYVSALTAHAGLGDHLDASSPEDPFVLLLGGEPVDPDLWGWLRQRSTTTSWNLYGPTEVGVDSLIASLAGDSQPDLGSPTAGTTAYVLDERLRPVPDGSVGELWLAGSQLADGYRGRSAETASRFVADPFSAVGGRMYRTGDLVVVESGAEGQRPRVRSLGRADTQVKIRGYRVEPAEVESVLRGMSEISQAVVRPRALERGTELLAWVTLGSGEGPDATPQPDLQSELMRRLRAALPGYMVPAAVSLLDEIPLTPNGKVDDRALPTPESSTARREGRAPRDHTEQAVADAFSQVLGAAAVTVEDSFFDLGGHSFLAQPVISAINTALTADLPVQAIFQAPTVEGLAALVDSGAADVAESLRAVLPLRREGTGNPLFAVHPGSGVSWSFSSLVTHLDTARPILGLQMPGIAPDEPMPTEPATMQELIGQYVDVILSEQPEGPFHLVGWSFGGRLAHAIAAALQEQGHVVGTLAVLDAYPAKESMAGITDEQSLWRAFLGAQGVPAPAHGRLSVGRARSLLREAGSPLASVPEETMRRSATRFRTIGTLFDRSPVPVYRGDLHLVEATTDVPANRPAPSAWTPHVTGEIIVEQAELPHERMLEPAGVHALAAVLTED